MSKFMIGQKVVYKDIEGRDTQHPNIVDVICKIVPDPDPDNELKRPTPFDYWIYNPLRDYIHSVSKDNIKPYLLEPLPHNLDDHIDHIDAAIFTGDTFNNDLCRIERLQEIMRSWNRQLESNKISIKENEDGE